MMKKNHLNIKNFYLFTITILLLLCLIIVTLSLFSKTVEQIDPPRSYLTKFDDIINLVSALLLGFIALMFSIYTYYKKQEQISIKEEFQKEILYDIIKRFYRNRIFIYSIKWNLQKGDTEKKYYPSESYFLLFKIPYETILMEKFNKAGKYNKLLEFALRIREFNELCDITKEHYQNKKIEIKQKDIEINRLAGKSSFLAKETMIIMCELGFLPPPKGNNYTDAVMQIKSHIEYLAKRRDELYAHFPIDEDLFKEVIRKRGIAKDLRVKKNEQEFFEDEVQLTDTMNKAIALEIPAIELINF
ncbi:MAG: hypothetical protein LBD59_00680 [Prevotellaceae bacterium]|jgi:hypothetical protein|nr:hypothetical protein [Prevotellaceae bacterium]